MYFIIDEFKISGFQIYQGIHQFSEKLDGFRCLAEIGEEDYLENTFSKFKNLEKK